MKAQDLRLIAVQVMPTWTGMTPKSFCCWNELQQFCSRPLPQVSPDSVRASRSTGVAEAAKAKAKTVRMVWASILID